MDEVEELLTIYQNAKCVVTRRLHCALPCLAMGVPTLLAIHTLESIRFIPYYDWLHCCLPEQFASGEYEYDVTNPPPNPTAHMETKQNLINSIKEFVDYAESLGDATADEINKFKKREMTIVRWRNKNMKMTAKMWEEELDGWLNEKEIKKNKETYVKIYNQRRDKKTQNKYLEQLMVDYLAQARRVFKHQKAAAKKKNLAQGIKSDQ